MKKVIYIGFGALAVVSAVLLYKKYKNKITVPFLTKSSSTLSQTSTATNTVAQGTSSTGQNNQIVVPVTEPILSNNQIQTLPTIKVIEAYQNNLANTIVVPMTETQSIISNLAKKIKLYRDLKINIQKYNDLLAKKIGSPPPMQMSNTNYISQSNFNSQEALIKNIIALLGYITTISTISSGISSTVKTVRVVPIKVSNTTPNIYTDASYSNNSNSDKLFAMGYREVNGNAVLI